MNIAIVTGASSGMGREFVKLLDNENLDELWGVGLEQENLDVLATQLKTKFRPFCCDLTNGGVDLIRNALAETKPCVKWLINAAGFGKFGRYDEIPVEQSLNMVRLNCETVVAMTEYTLPYMSEGSRIGEFCSEAAFQPTPYLNVYSATKAFIYNYSLALNVELKPRNIHVTAICPFWTATAFFDRAELENKVVTNFVAMYNPACVVKKAYKDMLKNKDFSMYGFKARSQMRLVKFLPVRMVMSAWCNQQKFGKRYK